MESTDHFPLRETFENICKARVRDMSIVANAKRVKLNIEIELGAFIYGQTQDVSAVQSILQLLGIGNRNRNSRNAYKTKSIKIQKNVSLRLLWRFDT